MSPSVIPVAHYQVRVGRAGAADVEVHPFGEANSAFEFHEQAQEDDSVVFLEILQVEADQQCPVQPAIRRTCGGAWEWDDCGSS